MFSNFTWKIKCFRKWYESWRPPASLSLRPCCYRTIFMKSKIEPLLSALSEINNGLTCYNSLNIIRENGNLFYSVFCPSNLFTWTHEIFQKIITSRLSDAGSHKKIVEINVYKFFLDMVECIFTNGKGMIP